MIVAICCVFRLKPFHFISFSGLFPIMGSSHAGISTASFVSHSSVLLPLSLRNVSTYSRYYLL